MQNNTAAIKYDNREHDLQKSGFADCLLGILLNGKLQTSRTAHDAHVVSCVRPQLTLQNCTFP